MSSGNSFHNVCSTREHNLNIAERQKFNVVTNNAVFYVFPMVINQYLTLFFNSTCSYLKQKHETST